MIELTKNKGLDTDENGHQFFNLTTLLRWKQQMNRDKDKPDIELIQNLMKGAGARKTLKKNSKKGSKKSPKKGSKKSSKKSPKKSSKKISKKKLKKTPVNKK